MTIIFAFSGPGEWSNSLINQSEPMRQTLLDGSQPSRLSPSSGGMSEFELFKSTPQERHDDIASCLRAARLNASSSNAMSTPSGSSSSFWSGGSFLSGLGQPGVWDPPTFGQQRTGNGNNSYWPSSAGGWSTGNSDERHVSLRLRSLHLSKLSTRPRFICLVGHIKMVMTVC